MKAIVIREPGGPDVLELRGVQTPEVPYGHVRVQVRYVGVNRADILQRMGLYPAPPGVPKDIPGLEYSGVVDEADSALTGFSKGERVMGLVAGGAYATHVIVHGREIARIPENVSDELAGATAEAFLTAYDALVVRGRLAPGERVLIHAAGSGVGTAGVQIARALGCTVIGTSRTKEKLDRAKPLGLDLGIVPEQGKFAEAVRAATKGVGADVVLDLVGGGYFPETLRACAKSARVVSVGLTSGRSSEIDLGLVMSQRLEIVGTVMRARPLEEKILAAKLLSTTIAPWLARGIVKPIVDRVFPLAEAGAAHALVQTDTTFGKVLLRALGSAPFLVPRVRSATPAGLCPIANRASASPLRRRVICTSAAHAPRSSTGSTRATPAARSSSASRTRIKSAAPKRATARS
jgi:putative PIG3 family NAD(P)H quinone oxidoreductase